MKAFALLILALGLSNAAHAASVAVNADKASNIEAALYDAGAQGDAGMGHSWVGGSNISCQVVVARTTTASCSADLDNASGSQVSTLVPAAASIELRNVLVAAGATETCMPGGCQLFVKSVSCQSSTNPEDAGMSTTCDIDQTGAAK